MQQCKLQARLMGSDFELIVTGTSETRMQHLLQAGVDEIRRLERLLTEFDDSSDTGRINSQAGIAAVPVDPEVYALIGRCLRLSVLTQGAFDISSGALKRLYNFKGATPALPSPAQLEQALQRTGYRHIDTTKANEVFLRREGMRIGFGAVGKGYAADCVRKLWQSEGVLSGVVNASGDLSAWGLRPDGQPWKVGIADPQQPDRILLWLPVDQASVATSGNYEQYFELNGIRYSHNIDPRTGQPAQWIKSATVVSPSAELSDALATAVTIMGIEIGLDLIDQLPGVHALIIDQENRVHTSQQIATHA
ncbi:FAD:protein FMN transferase [Taibaiella helva]|uniref:FAD:protein FMN transferase n=1 Tax=Taibaiella helva TaxID=2301235 RepID=UPI0018E4E078|nr:FAD:protein FMN transferase [Taibaiella helva]